MWILGLKGLTCKRLFRALDKVSWFCGPFLVQKRGGKSPGHLPREEGNGDVLLDGVTFSRLD